MGPQVREPERWVSEYDYPARRVSLTRADGEAIDVHWVGMTVDSELSDPEGRFTVFEAERRDGRARAVVKVVATLDDDGDLLCPHPDFDTTLIGSWTLWPYAVAGKHFGMDHWLWWSTGGLWTCEPRPWKMAATQAEDLAP